MLVGTNTLETLITLYALLELRVPALLVHPRLTAPERADLEAAAARAGPVPHRDAAAIIFTSGTTGESRGAVLTRSGLLASAQASAANLGWQGDDAWLLCMPVARVGGLSIVTRCLAARRCVVLAHGFDAGSLSGTGRHAARHAGFAGSDDADPRARRPSGLDGAGAPAMHAAGRRDGVAEAACAAPKIDDCRSS